MYTPLAGLGFYDKFSDALSVGWLYELFRLLGASTIPIRSSEPTEAGPRIRGHSAPDRVSRSRVSFQRSSSIQVEAAWRIVHASKVFLSLQRSLLSIYIPLSQAPIQARSPCSASTVPTPRSCIPVCGRMATPFRIPIPGLLALGRVS